MTSGSVEPVKDPLGDLAPVVAAARASTQERELVAAEPDEQVGGR